ncbi:MAG: hypothetical protein O2807_01550 [bacterium]|nr:hypothetical protein [bacterium]
MPNKWTLILLTILVVAATAVAIFIYRSNPNQLSAYGGIIGAAASILAVIWFTGSLWYQAQQIKEQRTQFSMELRQLREDGRRNALLLSRDVLNAAESRALAISGLDSLSELPLQYVKFGEFKDIMESDDPDVVSAAIGVWNKKEGPAVAIMNGLKSAAEVYFVAIGKEDVDFSRDPEEFVSIYGPQLWSLPFFEAFQGMATLLAEFMVRLKPVREAVPIAATGAAAKIGGEKYLRMDKAREIIQRHLKKKYPLPKIAEGLIAEPDNDGEVAT